MRSTGSRTDTGSEADIEDPRADLRWGTIARLLDDIAQSRPDHEAVVEGSFRTTTAELVSRSHAFAAGLIAAGVEAGDRVAIWGPNSTDWAVAALGTVSAGGILVTINTRFKGAEAAYVLRASGTKVLVTVEEFLGVDYPAMLEGEDLGDLEHIVLLGLGTDQHETEGARALPGRVTATPFGDFVESGHAVSEEHRQTRSDAVAPTDVADLLFTSGTTGRPKGVMMTHAQSLRTFGTWAQIVGLEQRDRYLIVNPFFHTFGYKAGLLACLMTGATAVPEAVFDVDTVLQRIETEKISVLPGPPTLYQSILSHPDRAKRDLTSLRLGVTGAAVVPVDLVRSMRSDLGFETVLTAYGLTESCGTVTMCRRTDPPEIVANTSGRAIPDLSVKVVDREGAECATGDPGEIIVKGYTVMQGYWGEDGPAAGTRDTPVDDDGWLHTGDIGIMDKEGNVTITDRLKDMFVVGGFNAYPAEIEALLAGCPGIGPCAVTGVPDDRMGEVGCVWLVRTTASPTTDEVTTEESFARGILDWARASMANYKVPRYAVVLDALPLNASGKVKKVDLRATFAALSKNRIYERKASS